MNGLINKYPKIAVALSGILAGGVYSFGLPALLLPVFLALFFWTVSEQKKQSSVLQTLKLTGIFYWAFYLVILIWFLDTDITLLAGLSSENARLFLGLCLFIMVGMLTFVSLPFGLILHKLRSRLVTADVWTPAVLSSAWVVIEWCRSWAFSIFLYAPGASMGDYWNFGSLGLGLIATPLGFLSRFLGMYGLSMLVVIMSLLIIRAMKKQFKPLLAAVVILIAVSAAGFLWNLQGANGDYIKASVLQREKDLDGLSSGVTDIKYLDDSPKEIIVLTEYSRIFTEGREKYAKKYVNDRLGENGISIDVSADFSLPGERYNTLEARDNAGRLVDSQTKQLLIPTGEYLPGLVQIFYRLTGQDSINQSFADTRQLYRGQPPRVIKTARTVIAPVACSGILGRNIYRQLVNDGGEVLTNSASLIIFSGSKAYFRQSLQMARFHAIANQRTYIQASMGAPAFVIDEDGGFIIPPEDTKTAFIDFSFMPEVSKTVYTRLGEWPLLIATLTVASFAGNQILMHVRSRRKN